MGKACHGKQSTNSNDNKKQKQQKKTFILFKEPIFPIFLFSLFFTLYSLKGNGKNQDYKLSKNFSEYRALSQFESFKEGGFTSLKLPVSLKDLQYFLVAFGPTELHKVTVNCLSNPPTTEIMQI